MDVKVTDSVYADNSAVIAWKVRDNHFGVGVDLGPMFRNQQYSISLDYNGLIELRDQIDRMVKESIPGRSDARLHRRIHQIGD